MARYKDYDYRQGKFIPISFDKQILPGTFEYTLNYLIDNELDLSVFDNRYCNDGTGAPPMTPRSCSRSSSTLTPGASPPAGK